MRLYDWWRDPGSSSGRPDFLSTDLKYDTGTPGLEDDDFVWWVKQKPPWRDLLVFGMLEQKDGGAGIRGIDGTTELRQRVSWFVEARDGRISRIV
ncbi:MAG TPA: hypothetical protein VK524_08200, partial [Polyangiaceae bacterium]|nr:hypothetical protein [Polyangiaceae bacterium]